MVLNVVGYSICKPGASCVSSASDSLGFIVI
jgi:hypothetical protein